MNVVSYNESLYRYKNQFPHNTLDNRHRKRPFQGMTDSNEDNLLKIRSRTDCPCGSGKIYHECCRPIHIGKASATTAEELMRSRYSAYFFRLVDYLISSTHPDKRYPELRADLETDIYDYMWRKLQILGKSQGEATDKKGKVEFVAQFHHDGKFQEHQEKSRFKKYKGKWKYLDGKG